MTTDIETTPPQTGWINELKRYWWLMLIPLSGTAIGLYQYARKTGEPGLLEYGLAAEGVILAVVAMYHMRKMMGDLFASH